MDSPQTIEHIAREFRQTGEVVHWPVPEALRRAPAVMFRDRGAEQAARQSVPQIIRSTMHASIADVDRLLRLGARHAMPEPLEGLGVELGAGPGLLGALVARSRRVRSVLAVDVCTRFARRVIPKVASHVLGPNARKVVPVVGSFDDLRLPDRCVDFAVEKDSLHHSDDLATTLGECARVLKPGRPVVCFDRCHPNSVTDDEVEEMVSRVYSRRFLVAHGYPPDAVLTRRDNGEHEYRLFEWQRAFDAAGLKLVRRVQLHARLPWDVAVAGLLSVLPRAIRPVRRHAPKASYRSFVLWLAQRCGVETIGRPPVHVTLAPERTTLFVLRKP